MAFTHLHVHSCYSLLSGASRLDELIARAVEQDFTHLALTDTNALYGAPAFAEKARQAGLEPIIGATIDDGRRQGAAHGIPGGMHHGDMEDTETHGGRTLNDFPRTSSPCSPCLCGESSFGEPLRRAVCLARSFETGYANLCRLVTARHLDEDFDLARALAQHQEDLFILTDSPTLLAELAPLIRPGGLYAELVHWSPDHGRDRRRVLAHGIPGGTASNKATVKETAAPAPVCEPLRGVLAVAREHRIEPVATNAVYFHAPERYEVHRVLTAIRQNCALDQVPARGLAHPQAWLKPAAEMRRLFREVPEALDTAERIARQCHVVFPTGLPIFPRVDLPPGETAFSRLSKLAFDGLARKYRPVTVEAKERLRYELGVIRTLGFCEYFLVVWDIVRYALSQDIPVVGRGSAANSLVSYCLGISNVDPLAYHLYFERFLNLSRSDCPDIDLDFDWRRRDEVIDYVYRTHGRDRVAMIATYNCFQARSAFRAVARTLSLAPDEVDRLASRLPFCRAAGIRDAILSFPESRDFPIDRPAVRRAVELAEMIDGFPRHLSVHVGGIVIADRPLTHYLPLERAAKGVLRTAAIAGAGCRESETLLLQADTRNPEPETRSPEPLRGVVITQYESGPVEALGLVKIDLLAQRSLSIVADTIQAARAHYGVKAQRDLEAIDRLPERDARTAAALRRGRTIGCFQIESPGMRSLLQMMRAATRQDVILGLSLIRPGPSSSGMKARFIRRRLGLERPEYLHPALREVLADTYGVMLYQEDILKVAHAVAGFTLEAGDQLRKAISKNRSPERLAALRQQFLDGAVANGTSKRDALNLWTQLANFAAYSYCKAHACTYGHIAFQAVYLKTRYPAEFLAAVLNNQAGFYEPRVYVEEARRWGVTILPPDVNQSDILHQSLPACRGGAGRGKSGGSIGRVSPPSPHPSPSGRGSKGEGSPGMRSPDLPRGFIRIGLMQVKHLTRRTMKRIVAERERRPFRTLGDFLERVRPEADEARALVLCGALDALQAPAVGRGTDSALPVPSAGTVPPGSEWPGHFGPSRPTLLWQLDCWLSGKGNGVGRPGVKVSDTIFRLEFDASPPEPGSAIPPLPDYSPRRRLELEEEYLDLTPSAHPLARYQSQIDRGGYVPSCALDRYVGREVTVVGYLIAARRAPCRGTSKSGDRIGNSVPRPVSSGRAARGPRKNPPGQDRPGHTPGSNVGMLSPDLPFMKFLTLEDRSGTIEVLLFPQVYQRYGHLIRSRGPFVVTGTVESRHGSLSIAATAVDLLAEDDGP